MYKVMEDNGINLYKKLFGTTNKFKGNTVRTLEKPLHRNTEYFVTPKLDGTRYLLLFGNNGGNGGNGSNGSVYRVSRKMDIELVNMRSNLNGTVLDTEFFQGVYYVFDILFYKGKDLRDLCFVDRLKYLTHVKTKIVPLKFKKYYPCSAISQLIRKYKKEMKNGIIDGIIINSNGSKGYYSTVYKWKPSWLLSIDFAVKKYTKDGKYYLRLLNYLGKPWKPAKKYTEKLGKLNPVQVSKRMYDSITNGSVVEVVYNGSGSHFEVLRPRPDKVHSNYTPVVNSVLNQIVNPVNVLKVC